MRNFIFILSLGLIFLLAACGSTEEKASSNSEPDTKIKGTLSEEDVEKLYSDPKKYKNYEVELTGKTFSEIEKDESGVYFQMWGDPENIEKNTIIHFENPTFDVKADQFVKVKGVVIDTFEGENAFGGVIEAPLVLASEVEVVDYITAIAPTVKELNVSEEVEQHGLKITLDKIELAENETRVYVKVNNDTNDKASVYSHNAKLVVGSKQLEEEYIDREMSELDELQSEILPGLETEGVIVYPAVDPDESIIKLHMEAYSDDYELDFKPFTFEVSNKE